MSAKLLSSLVQTKSIELVMAPIAAQVSQLIILNEAAERDGIAMPNLVSYARQINVCIESLVLVAQKLVSESSDEIFKTEMPEACSMVKGAGNSLHEATNKLLSDPFNHEIRYSLVDSARNILETTMNVLLVYDKGEVHKIVCAAHWVMDRLGLTEAVTSLKGFVVSFKGFSESLILLVSLCDKRQRELSNPTQRARLLSAMAILKKAVGLLSFTMQSYLKNPTDGQAKANRDYVVGQVKFACTEIIKIVVSIGEEDGSMEESSNMAFTLEKAHRQLEQSSRLDTSNQMDCYLDAIVRSSMAVAHTCGGTYKEQIVKACQNVLETRNDLTEFQKAVMSSPDSLRRRREFDMTAEKLSVELKKLDHQVTIAIADQISTLFCDVEQPIHELLAAATTPVTDGSTTALEQALLKTRQKADQFERHAAMLAQVSRQAASVSVGSGRAHIIKATSAELEKIAPVIVTSACAVRRNPFGQGATERLRLLCHDWTNRLQILTDAVDDVTDVRDLMETIETHIQHDIVLCREGLIEQNTSKIVQASRDALGRGKRVVQIAKKAMTGTANPLFKGELLTATEELKTVLPDLSVAIEKAILNLSNSDVRDKVNESIRNVGEKIKTIKTTVERPTGSSLDFINGDPTASETGDSVAITMTPDLLHIIQRANGVTSYPEDDITQPQKERVVSISHPFKIEDEVTGVTSPEPKPLRTLEKRFPATRPKSTSSPRLLRKLENATLSRSLESLLVKPQEDVKEADKRALLGLGSFSDKSSSPLSSLFGQPLDPSRTSRAPVTRLIRAAMEGDANNIEKHVKNLVSQVTKLMELAENCVEKSNKAEQVSQIRTASGEIEKLTPIITQAARDVTTNPRDFNSAERLHMIGREWASKVHVLGNAIDEIVSPWSAAASKLALAASSGDAVELKKQINNINSDAVRLRQLSSAAKAAADAEDYAMDPGNESDVLERDPASLQRIQLLRVTSDEIDKVLPELILAAQSVITNPTELTRIEALERLRRVWGCSVNNLIMAVDDVTVGTSAPVEHLTNAVMASDHHALQERLRMVTSYTRTLKEMASGATVGCSSPKKAALVESTIGSVERLTTDLQDMTRVVIDLSTRETKILKQQLAFMSIEEKMKLLRREWATKVHLLTSLVDDLTAHVSAPVDRLAGAALAVTKADTPNKRFIEREFEVQAQELSSRVVRVRNQASKAIEKSNHPSQVRTVRVTGDFIDRLTPQVIGAARALADNPDQDTVEHFQMLRRQWASKAQLLIATLQGLPDANLSAIQSVVHDLLGARANLQGAASFESLTEDDTIAISGTFRLLTPSPDSIISRELVAEAFLQAGRSPSPSRKVPSVAPKPKQKTKPRKKTPKMSSSFDDFDIGKKTRHHDRALSDTEALPDSSQRIPVGASSSETDLKSLLVQELHQRFSSNESLKRSKWDARYWAKFEMERRRHQRAFSMADLSRTSPEWRSESAEDLRARKSSKSIAMAAQFLQDEADQWEEENTSIVKIAKKMALQMMQMAQFARGRGNLQNKMEMINTAKAIAANATVILKFAHIIAEGCVDQRCQEDLLYYAECLPTMSTQLKIIASVKAATPSDPSADAMLVRNADNLMQAVVKTLKAAEAASVKELLKPQDNTTDEAEAADLAFQWKKKLQRQRKLEAFTASRDHLGLRRRETKQPTPSLADIVHV